MSKKPPKGKKTLAGSVVTIDNKSKSFGERVVDEAEAQGVEISESPVKSMDAAAQEKALKEQMELPGTEAAPLAVIVNGRMLAQMNKPTYGSEETEKYVELEFSIAMTEDEHRQRIPRMVKRAWKVIDDAVADYVGKINVSDQTVDIWLTSDAGDEDGLHLHLSGVPVTKAIVQSVDETGGGTAKHYVRYLFRVRAEHSPANCRFVDNHYDKKVWIITGDSQAEMGE